MVFRCGYFELRTFAFMAKMRECEVEKAKEWKCEDATVKREGECAKVWKRKIDTSAWCFAFATLHLRTFVFAFFIAFQQVSVDYIKLDAGTVLA